jgi:virulence-associated protein VagC
MADMIQTKLFRTGGSVALRIPAGWLDPGRPVELFRDPHTGRVYATQDTPVDTQDFFDFLRGKGFEPDPELESLPQRDDAPRVGPLLDGGGL